MHPSIQQARRFQELLPDPDADPAYSFRSIFDQKGWRAPRRSKKKLKLLKRMDTKIRAALQEGERVRYVTWGSGVSFLESYFLGWVSYYLNRRAILITDRRILMLQIDTRMRPRELASQLRYPAIRKIGRTLLGNTKIWLGDGKKCMFAYVPRADRKFLQNLVQYTGQRFSPESVGFEDLCPHCFAAPVGRPDGCGACGGTFKSVKRATVRSLVFPGLGDWYLGHRKIAVFEMLIAAVIWLGVLLPDPAYPVTPVALVVTALFVAVFVHGADALTTRHIARKGFYPDRSPSPVREDARSVAREPVAAG